MNDILLSFGSLLGVEVIQFPVSRSGVPHWGREETDSTSFAQTQWQRLAENTRMLSIELEADMDALNEGKMHLRTSK